MAIRIKQAAQILGVSTATVRNMCNNGELPYSISIAGQRIFDKTQLEQAIAAKQEHQPEHPTTTTIHYARSSSGDDLSVENQLTILEQTYGKPDLTITDKGSGLNDKRKGLHQLINHITNNPNTHIYTTTQDRLTRFGYTYLDIIFTQNNATHTSLNHPQHKQPQEELMQDFMSLIASFSGKFYRLRGWEQQRQLLNNAQNRIP